MSTESVNVTVSPTVCCLEIQPKDTICGGVCIICTEKCSLAQVILLSVRTQLFHKPMAWSV